MTSTCPRPGFYHPPRPSPAAACPPIGTIRVWLNRRLSSTKPHVAVITPACRRCRSAATPSVRFGPVARCQLRVSQPLALHGPTRLSYTGKDAKRPLTERASSDGRHRLHAPPQAPSGTAPCQSCRPPSTTRPPRGAPNSMAAQRSLDRSELLWRIPDVGVQCSEGRPGSGRALFFER
jgi:hypothetical protein